MLDFTCRINHVGFLTPQCDSAGAEMRSFCDAGVAVSAIGWHHSRQTIENGRKTRQRVVDCVAEFILKTCGAFHVGYFRSQSQDKGSAT